MGMFGGMQMNKTRLIDVLNMIVKGELEEGTKIKIGNDIYLWNKGMFRGRYDGEYETFLGPMHCLDAEVEIIGKDTNVVTKIEELSWEEAHNINGFNMNILNKLNEVIRELNRRGE